MDHTDEKIRADRINRRSMIMIVLGVLLCTAGVALILFAPGTADKMNEMPYLIGTDEDEATARLEEYGLTVIIETGESDAYDDGVVIGQSIEPGEAIEPGMTVTLTVNGSSIRMFDNYTPPMGTAAPKNGENNGELERNQPGEGSNGKTPPQPGNKEDSPDKGDETGDGSTGDGSTGGGTGGGSTESGSTGGGSTESGSTESGSTGGGGTESGSTGGGSAGGGSTESGSTGGGNTGGGSTGDGGTGGGNTGDGGTRDGTVTDAPSAGSNAGSVSAENNEP